MDAIKKCKHGFVSEHALDSTMPDFEAMKLFTRPAWPRCEGPTPRSYEDIVGRKWRVVVHVSEQTFEGRTFEFHADYPITVRARSAILAEDEALRLIANRFRAIEVVPTLHATEVRDVR